MKTKIEIPAWIQGIDAEALNDPSHEYHDDEMATVRSISEHGCESGAYMPAVTSGVAVQTMNEHGDEILDFIDGVGMDEQAVLRVLNVAGWESLACYFVSAAVELWAHGVIEAGGD